MAAVKSNKWLQAAFIALASLAGLLALLIALVASGVIFDVSFVRQAVEEELGQVLGHRAVLIEGDLLFAPSFSVPGVRAESVRVLSPGSPPRDWARIKAVELGVRLSALWEGELELNHILAEGLTFPLDAPGQSAGQKTSVAEPEAIRIQRLSGSLHLAKERTTLGNLRLALGQSLLTGSLEAHYPQGGRPRLKVDLKAPTVSLDDFQPLLAKPAAKPEKDKPAATAGDGKRQTRPVDVSRLEKIIRGGLDSLDGEFRLEVGRVLSGPDELGRGLVMVRLKDRRFSVEPLEVELPGGIFRLEFSCEDRKPDLAARLKLKVRNFQYGFYLRRMDPKSKAGGVISLETDLTSVTPGLGRLMEHAHGRLAFGLWPKDLDAGLIDLWAANLITALFDRFSEKGKSRINCLQVVLDMKKGRMTQKKVVLDTSSLRVNGEADIDFNTQKIYALFTPQAKRPQYFSLEIPVEIKGSFSDFSTGVQTGGLFGGAMKALISPLHVPLVRLFSKEPPADGGDVCPLPQTWRPLAAAH